MIAIGVILYILCGIAVFLVTSRWYPGMLGAHVGTRGDPTWVGVFAAWPMAIVIIAFHRLLLVGRWYVGLNPDGTNPEEDAP